MIFDIVIQLCIEEFMSIKKIFVLCTVLCCIFFSLTGCSYEDGDIKEWVGTYHWYKNVEETWHQFITGEKAKQKEWK